MRDRLAAASSLLVAIRGRALKGAEVGKGCIHCYFAAIVSAQKETWIEVCQGEVTPLPLAPFPFLEAQA